MAIPSLRLGPNNSIPQIGLGLWKIKDPQQFNTTFTAGVAAGYRHFDSAQIYDNEQLLGRAWRQSGLSRQQYFLTTKISVTQFGYRRTKRSFEASLKKLKTDYVDLLLLHFPLPVLRRKSWQALEEIQESGGAVAIGVSNYTIRHLETMKHYAHRLPAINQVELHVFLQQPELLQYCFEHDIMVEAYSPLAHGRSMDNPVITDIAQKHHKTYAQVMLRWCIEQGLIVIPKSTTPSRISQNIDIFDFAFQPDELESLSRQNLNLRTCWNPTHIP